MLYKTLNLFMGKLRTFKGIFLFFLGSFLWYSGSAVTPLYAKQPVEKQPDSLFKAATILYVNKDYKAATALYEQLLKQHPDSVLILKNIALSAAALPDAERALRYAERYIRHTADINFLKNPVFENIEDSVRLKELKEKYVPRLDVWSILYLYTAIIGTFIALVLNFKKNAGRVANLLISIFIFIHSLFIIHICLYITNYKYYFPHSLLATASFSFLYGPLMYFYFKRVIQRHRFKLKDSLHLLPFAVYLIYVFPIYNLSGAEKLKILLTNEQQLYSYLVITSIAKFISLLVYGYLIWKVYAGNRTVFKKDKLVKWQENILKFYMLYIISYAVYALIITNIISITFLHHTQIIAMSSLVLYVGYTAYVQPDIFGMVAVARNGMLFKYEKSGLTKTYSEELKENLVKLLEEEKIYRDNTMNLEMLSEKLGTTRHNASQVINEHFDINFFELINRYRINDALEILKNDNHRNFNIIDVAYEVGFNNKVTFNKAFKKETSLTPTQYIEMVARDEFIRLKLKNKLVE